LLVEDVRHCDKVPIRRQCMRDRLPDSAGGAGYERDA
jgi:hypothetical protein